MSIRVVKQGLLHSIQDLGRFGCQHLGIPPGGVMDRVAAQAANFLVGNTGATAVMEFHYPAPALLWEEEMLFCLSGADFGAAINGIPIPLNTPIVVSRYSLLHFTQPVQGSRCYLAVKGGFRLQPWLNSYSTQLKAGAGGFKGRLLQRDDVLPFSSAFLPAAAILGQKDCIRLSWRADISGGYLQGRAGFLHGRQWRLLSPQSQEAIEEQGFRLSRQSDRMGYRLQGPSLVGAKPFPTLLSSGVCRGTLQLLPDGQLILLMADHQTTGGYPVIGCVASAYLPQLAQMKALDTLLFRSISQWEAEQLLQQQGRFLQQLQNACTLQLNTFLSAYEH